MKDKIKDLNNLEEKLYNYNGADKMIASNELSEILAKLPEPTVMNTGVPTIDRILGGVEGGELVIVTGPSGHGKTTMLMSITQNMSKAGIESAWFTLEVTPRQFLKKLSVDGVLPHFYLPAENVDGQISWLFDRIVESIVKYNTRVIFIDHLHSLFSLEKSHGNLSLELGDIVATIKQLAIEYGIVIFLIAHSTDNKLSPTSEPSMRDIRDSGMVSRLADSVIGVWRIKKPEFQSDLEKKKMTDDFTEEDNWAKIKIFKNRREGILGYFYAIHEHHRFVEVDHKDLPKDVLDRDF